MMLRVAYIRNTSNLSTHIHEHDCIKLSCSFLDIIKVTEGTFLRFECG